MDSAEPFWLRYFLALGDDRLVSDAVGMKGSSARVILGEEVGCIWIEACSEGIKSPLFDLVPFTFGITMVKSSAAFVGL